MLFLTISWYVTHEESSLYFLFQLSPPAPLWTRTTNWREKIKEGDEIEIRESTSLVQRPKWHRATVLVVGGENDTPQELTGGAELEVFEVNSRKVPLMLLNLKRQVRFSHHCFGLVFCSHLISLCPLQGPCGSAPGNAQLACRHSTSTDD